MEILEQKNWRFENFQQNICHAHQKKAENKENSDSGWKSMIYFLKNHFLKFFSIIFLKDVRTELWFSFLNFSKFSNSSWKLASMGPSKCPKKQSHEIWANLKRPRDIWWCGQNLPIPAWSKVNQGPNARPRGRVNFICDNNQTLQTNNLCYETIE